MTAEMVNRISAFAIVFGLLAFWEVWRPRRRLVMSKVTRWVAICRSSSWMPWSCGSSLELGQ